MIKNEFKPRQETIGNNAGINDATPSANIEGRVTQAPPTWGSKIVLLVDANPRTRDSRAKVLRTLGVIVHSAASATTARARLATSAYNLVLVDLGRDIEGAESLVAEIRAKNRRQRVAFLVGRPLYVSSSLKHADAMPKAAPVSLTEASVPVLTTTAISDFGQRIKDAEAKQAA